MKVSLSKRTEYWNYFVERWIVHKEGGGNEITGPRLQKIKPVIFNSEYFWEDVVLWHDGMDKTPFQMFEDDPETYYHCQGNFWGMICAALVDTKIIKVRG